MEAAIRNARKTDAKGLLAHVNMLIAEDAQIMVFGRPFTLREEEAWLAGVLKEARAGDAVCLVAESGGEIVGEAFVRRKGSAARKTRTMHVGEFGIAISHPEFRGKGLGKRLAKAAFAAAKRKGMGIAVLDVFEGNAHALALYRSLGFREFGRLPGAVSYRGRKVAKVLMFKRL
jgi:ribosomal protein S18 acetylase RimI-like enzyme